MVPNPRDLVRQMLAQHGGKQEDLAEKLKVSQPTISRWLKGAEPRGPTWQKIVTEARERGLVPAEEQKRVKTAAKERFVTVPVVTWVSAGRLTDAAGTSQVESIGQIAVADLGEGDFIALKVTGTSMDRISPDGSIIIVNRAQKSPQENRPFVFAYRGEATYKLWRSSPARLEPSSTDPSNEPIFIDKRERLFVLGRVRRTILDL